MWRWLPWRVLLSRLARSRGFVDPVELMARLHRFAQPSEVTEPVELLRAGVAFHARGLLNARAIQHNLDWAWPYWVARQFDPKDVSFVPRAFSITHVNLTHRNWTAVGLPDLDALPVVDPRGLVTPLHDGWSLDAWVFPAGAGPLLPSRADDADQRLRLDGGVAVDTAVRGDGCELASAADVTADGGPACRVRYTARAEGGGLLVVAVRPANPEGVRLVHDIRRGGRPGVLHVDGVGEVRLDATPRRVCMSDYHRGDVLHHLGPEFAADRVDCPVGLATAAAVYELEPGRPLEVTALVPLPAPAAKPVSWGAALAGACELAVPDGRTQFLWDAAVRTLVLHAPLDVYPGPFTYKRFWFRDAAFIQEALLALGLFDRVRRALERFPSRQLADGYFRSQEGEWDSNGAALWAIDRYRRLSGRAVGPALARAVARGADWVCRKRLPDGLAAAHAGLMPAGFSAEHLGLNDFYFWDDFWSAAGLRAAAATAAAEGGRASPEWERTADKLLAAVDRAAAATDAGKAGRGVPASPYRRMDAGAVGNLAAGYPLRLWPARDPRLLATAEFLLANCLERGGFFQDMIHSGVNVYLTLHLAQVLLRAGDPRAADLARAVADLATPTGQWPEAVHPHTGGGCMGDGQHVWAAAEWVLWVRNLFVREEGDGLVLGSGLPPEWAAAGPARLGPTPTPFGPVTVEAGPADGGVRVSWSADWRGKSPELRVGDVVSRAGSHERDGSVVLRTHSSLLPPHSSPRGGP